MTEFNETQQSLITELFMSLNNENIEYVVPRGYRELPQSVPGGDIDILVQQDDYPTAISITKKCGYQTSSQLTNFVDLVKEGLKKYRTVLNYLITEPSTLYKEIKNVFFQEHSDYELIKTSYSEYKAYNDGVMVHLMNHLAYKSPLNGQKIRVDPYVEEAIHRRSIQDGILFRPSKPDELAHLLCRGIFDKDGVFPQYYIKRCDSLWEDIREDKELRSDLNELLSLLFFEANKLVYTNIENSSYNNLKPELTEFSNY